MTSPSELTTVLTTQMSQEYNGSNATGPGEVWVAPLYMSVSTQHKRLLHITLKEGLRAAMLGVWNLGPRMKLGVYF